MNLAYGIPGDNAEKKNRTGWSWKTSKAKKNNSSKETSPSKKPELVCPKLTNLDGITILKNNPSTALEALDFEHVEYEKQEDTDKRWKEYKKKIKELKSLREEGTKAIVKGIFSVENENLENLGRLSVSAEGMPGRNIIKGPDSLFEKIKKLGNLEEEMNLYMNPRNKLRCEYWISEWSEDRSKIYPLAKIIVKVIPPRGGASTTTG